MLDLGKIANTQRRHEEDHYNKYHRRRDRYHERNNDYAYDYDDDYYRRIYMRILPSVFFTLKTGSLSIGIRESFFVG